MMIAQKIINKVNVASRMSTFSKCNEQIISGTTDAGEDNYTRDELARGLVSM